MSGQACCMDVWVIDVVTWDFTGIKSSVCFWPQLWKYVLHIFIGFKETPFLFLACSESSVSELLLVDYLYQTLHLFNWQCLALYDTTFVLKHHRYEVEVLTGGVHIHFLHQPSQSSDLVQLSICFFCRGLKWKRKALEASKANCTEDGCSRGLAEHHKVS